MARSGGASDAELSLATRAAWLHYTAGMTQSEVAARLGVSATKVNRLIAFATQQGAVRITVEGPIVECLELEVGLRERFALSECHVAPDLAEQGLPLRALGAEAARLVERELSVARPFIGVGHGRSLSAVVEALPQLDVKSARLVALMGALTRNMTTTPHDVVQRLAARTGAEAHVLPVPFFANSPQDRAVLQDQHAVRRVFDLGAEADLLLVGIGTTRPDAQLVAAGMVDPAEIAALRDAGAVGELLGHFFDARGAPVRTGLTDRTLGPTLDSLRNRRIVAVAGGAAKTDAIAAVLRAGLVTGLLTDEATARTLLQGEMAEAAQ